MNTINPPRKLSPASTKYNDLSGSIAIDFKGISGDIEQYAIELGIDTTKFIPVGIRVHDSEGGSIKPHEILIDFYALDTTTNEIYMEENDGKKSYVIFRDIDTLINLLSKLTAISIELVFSTLNSKEKLELIEIWKEIELNTIEEMEGESEDYKLGREISFIMNEMIDSFEDNAIHHEPFGYRFYIPSIYFKPLNCFASPGRKYFEPKNDFFNIKFNNIQVLPSYEDKIILAHANAYIYNQPQLVLKRDTPKSIGSQN